MTTPPPSLLTLPPELRNAIYTFVLVPVADSCASAALAEPSLLHINRQIRRETVRIFYDSNVFALSLAPKRRFLGHRRIGTKELLASPFRKRAKNDAVGWLRTREKQGVLEFVRTLRVRLPIDGYTKVEAIIEVGESRERRSAKDGMSCKCCDTVSACPPMPSIGTHANRSRLHASTAAFTIHTVFDANWSIVWSNAHREGAHRLWLAGLMQLLGGSRDYGIEASTWVKVFEAMREIRSTFEVDDYLDSLKTGVETAANGIAVGSSDNSQKKVVFKSEAI